MTNRTIRNNIPSISNLRTRAARFNLAITKAADATMTGHSEYVLHPIGADWENMAMLSLWGIANELKAIETLANTDELGIPYSASALSTGDNIDLTASEREAIARLENTVIVSPPAKRSASPNRPANVDAAMEANSRAFPYYANRASIEILVIDREERVRAAPTALLRQDYSIEEHVQEALESVGIQSTDDWAEIRMKWFNPKSESGK